MGRRPITATLLLVAVCAALLLPALGRIAVYREQELRVLLTARNMARGGSWLLPVYDGALRLRKPPLAYWMTAAAYRLAGTDRSPRAARLPSAAFAAGLVALVYLGGRRLVGRRAAFLGAMAAATSHLFVFYGCFAETDFPLAVFTALATLAAGRALRTGRLRTWVAAGLLAGLGFLAKGPAALVMPAAAGLAFAVTTPRARRAPRRRGAWRGPLAALGAAAAVAAPWYVFLLAATRDGASARQAIDMEVAALTVQTGHPGPAVYYAYTVLAALLPWGPLLLLAAAPLWRHARRHAASRFLLCWLGSSLLVLTLLRSKQAHYTILVLMPLALVLGRYLARLPLRARDLAGRLGLGYLAVLRAAAALAGTALALAPRVAPVDRPAACTAAGVAVVAAALLSVRRDARGDRRFAALAAAFGLLAWGYAVCLYPAVEPKSAYPAFAAAVRPRTDAARRVYLCGNRRKTLGFYLGRALEARTSPRGVTGAWQPGDALVVHRRTTCDPPHDLPDLPPAAYLRRGDVELAFYEHP